MPNEINGVPVLDADVEIPADANGVPVLLQNKTEVVNKIASTLADGLTATGSVDGTGNTIDITKGVDGSKINLDFAFKGLNDNAAKALAQGLTASATLSDADTPSVDVNKTVDGSNVNLGFDFKGLGGNNLTIELFNATLYSASQLKDKGLIGIAWLPSYMDEMEQSRFLVYKLKTSDTIHYITVFPGTATDTKKLWLLTNTFDNAILDNQNHPRYFDIATGNSVIVTDITYSLYGGTVYIYGLTFY